jgi:hypothetical protein
MDWRCSPEVAIASLKARIGKIADQQQTLFAMTFLYIFGVIAEVMDRCAPSIQNAEVPEVTLPTDARAHRSKRTSTV